MKIGSRIKKALRVVRREGLLRLLILSLLKIEKELRKSSKSDKVKFKINFLTKYNDALRADWSGNPYVPPKAKKTAPYSINWVMSPPDRGGGHQNIFRFIKYLEDQGHTCRIYLYSVHDLPTIGEVKQRLAKSYPDTRAEIRWLDNRMEPADAIFATGWETAYPVFNDKSNAHKFYFVQDFEPYFYPVSSEYVLAENTYRFNFFGITAGGWLAHKLNRDYGMPTANYDFGADKQLYRYTNDKPRKEVFFYARPVTARRGFELGIMALQLFHEKMPDYTITLAGWDVSDYAIPFPYKNLKSLQLNELSDVYNQSAAALVISLTNMSLIPLELLATGVIPVVTDGPNNREVSDNKYIQYTASSPQALADALVEVVTKKDLPKYVKEASKSVQGLNWDASCAKFEEILKEKLNG